MATEEIEEEYDEDELDDIERSKDPNTQAAIKVQAAKENKVRPLFKITWKRAAHLKTMLGYFGGRSGYRDDVATFHIDPKTGITAESTTTRLSLDPICFDVYDIKKAGKLSLNISGLLNIIPGLDRNAQVTIQRLQENKASMQIVQGDTTMTTSLQSYRERESFPVVGELPIEVSCDRTKLINAIIVAARGRSSGYGSNDVHITVTKSGNVAVSSSEKKSETSKVDITRYCEVKFNVSQASISNSYPDNELHNILSKLHVPTVTLMFGIKRQSPLGIMTYVFEESISYVGTQPYGKVELIMPAARSY